MNLNRYRTLSDDDLQYKAKLLKDQINLHEEVVKLMETNPTASLYLVFLTPTQFRQAKEDLELMVYEILERQMLR